MYIVVSDIEINFGSRRAKKKYKMVSKIVPFIFYTLHSGIENNKK